MRQFDEHSTAAEVLAGVDLSGRVAIVTGAASGLGLETVRCLAASGAHVVATTRDASRSEAVAEAVRSASPRAGVTVHQLDLASLDSIRSFAEKVLAEHTELHLQINNAGVMAPPLSRTADGFELQLGTNYLGHFLLTALLTPALLRGAPARIVNLSSYAHVHSDFDWADPHYRSREYNAMQAYAQSKTALILLTVELERRLGPYGVHAYAVHPGIIDTQLARHMPESFAASAARVPDVLKLKSPEAGAATTAWAATAPELADQGGLYLEDCHVSDEEAGSGLPRGHAKFALDPVRAAKLWDWSEAEVGQSFIAP